MKGKRQNSPESWRVSNNWVFPLCTQLLLQYNFISYYFLRECCPSCISSDWIMKCFCVCAWRQRDKCYKDSMKYSRQNVWFSLKGGQGAKAHKKSRSEEWGTLLLPRPSCTVRILPETYSSWYQLHGMNIFSLLSCEAAQCCCLQPWLGVPSSFFSLL